MWFWYDEFVNEPRSSLQTCGSVVGGSFYKKDFSKHHSASAILVSFDACLDLGRGNDAAILQSLW